MSYESIVKADAPLGFWRLGEAAGTVAADSSGNGLAGAYKGAPTLGVAGLISPGANKAVTLAATSKQFVEVPNSGTLDFGDVVTVEAWIRRATLGTAQALLDKGAGSLIVRLLATNKILVRRNSVANICESTVALADSLIHHVVVTKSGAAVHVYVDGVDVTGPVVNSTLVNNTSAFGIGVADVGAGEEEFLDGTIDEVAVYGTALSAERVRAHYAAGATRATLAAAATIRAAPSHPSAHPSAGVRASAAIDASLRVEPRATSSVAVRPAAAASLRIDRRIGAAVDPTAVLGAAGVLLPQSQHVFLDFQLDRTSVPYVAERR